MDFDPDPWKKFWIRIRQYDADNPDQVPDQDRQQWCIHCHCTVYSCTVESVVFKIRKRHIAAVMHLDIRPSQNAPSLAPGRYRLPVID